MMTSGNKLPETKTDGEIMVPTKPILNSTCINTACYFAAGHRHHCSTSNEPSRKLRQGVSSCLEEWLVICCELLSWTYMELENLDNSSIDVELHQFLEVNGTGNNIRYRLGTNSLRILMKWMICCTERW
ncbi:hypothetical protein QQG55_5265 [Brugia pahangi]